ncbi:MAG: RNA methyltransferase [Gemmatimonadetes bacterium]|nr:RNA methyltransferase [Gemmatimonadota bacterium]
MPSKAELKLWRSLKRRKGREASGLFLAEGPRQASEMVKRPQGTVALLHTAEALHRPAETATLTEARRLGVRVEEVSSHVLDALSDTSTPQPVLAVGRIPEWGWADVGAGLMLFLDGVQDPGNVGGLVRTAAALGAAGVACLEGTADPWGPKAARAAAGAGLRIPVFRTSAQAALDQNRDRAWPVWVADAGGDCLTAGDVPEALALVLGGEGSGVSDLLRSQADRTVGIAMAKGVESLNVAASGALLIDRILNRSRGSGQSGAPE